MKEKDYKSHLATFKQEVKQLHEQIFVDGDKGYGCDEPLNGVEIGYAIEDQCARKLIHYVGLKHGLLVFCPNDVVDLDVRDGKMFGSIIRTDFCKLRIKP